MFFVFQPLTVPGRLRKPPPLRVFGQARTHVSSADAMRGRPAVGTDCEQTKRDLQYIWPWVKTYGTIFGWMNIHLPAILMFTRGTEFWLITIYIYIYIYIYIDRPFSNQNLLKVAMFKKGKHLNWIGRSYLVGGLEHDFYFFHIFGMIIPIDGHIFQRVWNHRPV